MSAIVSNMTRVVGFLTDVSDWNKVRRWEYTQRKFYAPDDSMIHEEPRALAEGVK